MTQRIGGGYSRSQRVGETAAVVAFFAVEIIMIATLFRTSFVYWLIPVAITAVIAGALLADLISGVVHWACDTWGTIDTPLMGRLFIRQFREHHVDPEEINRHDFVETNGTNAGLALIPLGVTWSLPFDLDSPTLFAFAFQVGGIALAFFVTFTSQAHKWAHAASVPWYVRLLQRMKLVLSKEHHAIHHAAPHRHHYSITGGWVDWWLEKFRVFRVAEAIIMRVTGARMQIDIPLEDAAPDAES